MYQSLNLNIKKRGDSFISEPFGIIWTGERFILFQLDPINFIFLRKMANNVQWKLIFSIVISSYFSIFTTKLSPVVSVNFFWK